MDDVLTSPVVEPEGRIGSVRSRPGEGDQARRVVRAPEPALGIGPGLVLALDAEQDDRAAIGRLQGLESPEPVARHALAFVQQAALLDPVEQSRDLRRQREGARQARAHCVSEASHPLDPSLSRDPGVDQP
ncbi:hypothetical protein [Methylobacterium sp. 77]|uniref:hypothetical protein n=1 Tax=Methylobacterium sp. 77 TaxID=1101192 RepID=UPI00036F3F1B|nr:hypothetical protein [Methylobacterium sp. 77]